MEYWQDFGHPSETRSSPLEYDAVMPDGSTLTLPLRDLGEVAVAGLILNQASFRVLDRLNVWLAVRARRFAPDIVIGLPTLGHVAAQGVARALGHARWAAAGFSRKRWYEDALSVPVASITSPLAGRRMWLDPRLLPRLAGLRVLLVDDVVSSGASLQAGLALLRAADAAPIAAAVTMIQGDRWQADWPVEVPLVGAFATPLFRRAGDAWLPLSHSAPHALCHHVNG